jgi:phage terminase large subunit
VKVQFPEKLDFLLRPHKHPGVCGNHCGRFKVPYGGRGGLKSYAAADAAIIRAGSQYERIFCVRETMDSIDESVRFLLEKRITDLGVTHLFECEKYSIRTRHTWKRCKACGAYDNEPRGCQKCDMVDTLPSEFIFAGIRSDPGKVKSLEGATIVWAEEAHGISDGTWDIIIPTIRWQDRWQGVNYDRKSEIWITYNPRYETDATHVRFTLNPPDSAIVCKTSYLDNPWFPDVLRSDMERDLKESYAKYAHIWLGECATQVEGAIFGEQMRKADEDKRIGRVSYDRTKPVWTFWDLGFGDLMAIWFAQSVAGWFNVIDYEEGGGLTIADWIVKLQQKGYVYGPDWLPHDGVDAQLHHRLTGDRTRSVEQLMRAAGRNVRVAAKMAVHDRINAARTILPQCRFDAEGCRDGLHRLRHYQWGPAAQVGAAKAQVPRREPLHDAASHGADAFCTLAVSIKQEAAPERKQQAPPKMPVSAWT